MGEPLVARLSGTGRPPRPAWPTTKAVPGTALCPPPRWGQSDGVASGGARCRRRPRRPHRGLDAGLPTLSAEGDPRGLAAASRGVVPSSRLEGDSEEQGAVPGSDAGHVGPPGADWGRLPGTGGWRGPERLGRPPPAGSSRAAGAGSPRAARQRASAAWPACGRRRSVARPAPRTSAGRRRSRASPRGIAARRAASARSARAPAARGRVRPAEDPLAERPSALRGAPGALSPIGALGQNLSAL